MSERSHSCYSYCMFSISYCFYIPTCTCLLVMETLVVTLSFPSVTSHCDITSDCCCKIARQRKC